MFVAFLRVIIVSILTKKLIVILIIFYEMVDS